MPRKLSIPHHSPPRPGTVLREQVLPQLGLSVSRASRELGVTRQSLHKILAGTAAVSPEMAVRLGRLSGTRPDFWLGLQMACDLRDAENALADELSKIPAHTLPDTLLTEIGRSHGTRP
ncbi:HigA family addiction module antitoxin [Arenibaculum pallidiluteum]|uniref:HigA family addiction module antitoxin n=1 Tax=Arenibaculum pallidiluteum TaxID=2812559 RepID=UPI001A96406E|nr:HigA family addiction module antitoxin [Arenibaculum pallidiluteum]